MVKKPRQYVHNIKDTLSICAENISLRQLVNSINFITGKNITLDSKLYDKNIILNMKSDIDSIIEYLCNMHDIVFIDNILKQNNRIIRTHNITFLMNKTNSSNNINISTVVDKNSHVNIDDKSQTDFWKEFIENIQLIIGANNFSVNKQAGILIANCNESEHIKIQKYISLLQKSLNRKILIEARIVEVELKNVSEAGINWNKISENASDINYIKDSHSTFTMNLHGDFNSVINLLAEYGNTKTIANPFISVLNNHTAIFKSAQNEVYFAIQKEHKAYKNYDNEIESSVSSSIPVGIMLMTQATIDENQNIILSLRPTISKVVRYEQDPVAQKKSVVPVIHTKEMYTTISTKPGKIILIGGLLEEDNKFQSTGMPIICKLPIIGAFFGRQSFKRNKTELVIILKAHIEEDL